MDKLIILAVAIVFGIARFVVPVEGKIAHDDIFKDMAHIAVGFMFGYATYAESQALKGCDIRNRIQLWAIPIGLTILEVVAFVVRKQ